MNWKTLTSIGICYLLLVFYLVVSGKPDPGYERLWLVAAFFAAAIYIVPILIFLLIYRILRR